MSIAAAGAAKRLLSMRPAELVVGDLVHEDDGFLRVVDEPMTFHRGLSPFDDFEILVGAYVAGEAPEAPKQIWMWPVDQMLDVQRAPSAAVG